jgi:hypothetical protein
VTRLAAALCAAWCASDARRTATGTDLDEVELAWGAAHVLPAAAGGGDAPERMCLLLADVRDDPLAAPRLASGWGCAFWHDAAWKELRARRADVACALNSAICFMHSREDADRYCRQARAMTAAPGIFVMDLQGGATMEKALTQRTRLPSCDYLWSQDGFDPVSRLISCHIGFRLRGRRGAPPPPTPPALRRAFSYRWRLWTLPEVCDMLRQAGFASTHVWVRLPHSFAAICHIAKEACAVSDARACCASCGACGRTAKRQATEKRRRSRTKTTTTATIATTSIPTMARAAAGVGARASRATSTWR